MAKRRFLGRLRAAVVVAFLGGTGQAHAIACADPVTYLYICCPKPCQINDGQNIIQNVLKESMEVSKLTSMISQMTAWKDQLSMFGQTLNMINSLISQLFGARGAAFSGFGNPTLIPQGLSGNPFNIGQMAGQVGRLFFRPGATQGDEINNAARRTGLVSAGYIESMASGINGRTTLVTAQTEFRDLTKVVNNAASTDTGGSRDENDVNVHTDLAAMNQTRIAMLRSTQNQLTSANVQLMTDSYNALGKMGVDNQADRSGWSGGLSTGEIQGITPALTKLAANGSDLNARADLLAGVVGSLVRGMFVTPAQAAEPVQIAQATTTGASAVATSPYGSAKGDYDSALANGFTNPDAVAAAKSSDAFQNYDNLMERAVQVHNAATAYVSMMGTIQLNQETIALYNLTLAAATEQRRRVVEGLSLFYSNPDAAFSAMAIEAVGPDAMSGMDPYQYGDSVSQQAAAAAALKTISTKVQYQLGLYGTPVCRDVWRYNNRWVAQFLGAPAQWTPVLQAIYANPRQETCGKLLSQWLNAPAAPLYDAATDTSGLNIAGSDIDPSNASAVSTAALNEFLSDSNNSIQGPNFTYWIELAKRGLWMKDYAAHATEVIANTRTAITDLQANTNDPSTTLVLQSLPGIGPVDLTNGAGVQAQVNTLLSTAATWRGQVDSTTLGTEAVALRDTQLQAAGLVIKGDAAFQKWASAAPAMSDVPCATQQCWGASDATWAQPVTVMGQNVGAKNPSPALPIAAADALTSQPTKDQAMSYCATLSVNTPDKSFVSCPVQPQAGFYPTALTPPPFGTGIGIQP